MPDALNKRWEPILRPRDPRDMLRPASARQSIATSSGIGPLPPLGRMSRRVAWGGWPYERDGESSAPGHNLQIAVDPTRGHGLVVRPGAGLAARVVGSPPAGPGGQTVDYFFAAREITRCSFHARRSGPEGRVLRAK